MADTARIYDLLAELGGDKLVGRSKTMAPGTFWPVLVNGF
jgi:NitT/TauT family transport system substrate-binding protein